MKTFRLDFPSDVLFARMLRIVDDAGARYGRAFPWTFGGGTVLALRHAHRFSKDIDIFVRDPQYLGYLSPRLSDVAALDDPDYEEAAEFLKLRYREGEIDFVVARPLTTPGSEPAMVQGRTVDLETDVEIVAKKLHHRGDRFKARDLFDLALVLERVPGSPVLLAPWARRCHESIRRLLTERLESLRPTFEAIDAREYRPSLENAARKALVFLDDID